MKYKKIDECKVNLLTANMSGDVPVTTICRKSCKKATNTSNWIHDEGYVPGVFEGFDCPYLDGVEEEEEDYGGIKTECKAVDSEMEEELVGETFDPSEE